jgi:osmotically-inducible protein OsmY
MVTGSAASSSDQALLDQVVGALASDPSLSGAALSVTVSNGVVNISGHARDQAQANRARDVAANVAGDSRVSAAIQPQA